MIRRATFDDVLPMVFLEGLSFSTDRISRRSFRHLVAKSHGLTLVDEDQGVVRGYVSVLFNAKTSLARVYSIAVHPDHRGKALGRLLLRAAEEGARAEDRVEMRLEVRADNVPSIKLYESEGYRRFGVCEDYYEDHTEAVRYKKRLSQNLGLELTPTGTKPRT